MSAEFHQSPTDESIILKPYAHLYSNAKKTELSDYIETTNRIIKAPQEAVEVISDVWYMIYRSLGLTDDIVDNSKYRGKIPTAHQVFGITHSLIASWYSLFLAAEKLLTLKQPKAVELLVKNMKLAYAGQAKEAFWRDSFQCPTEEEFTEMTYKKTGAFLSLPTDLLQLFVQDQQDLTKLNKLLSFYYEAQDDMDDLQLGTVEGYSEDINEGKFGFPLVLAINRHPEKLDMGDIAAGMKDITSRGSYIHSVLKESNALVCCQEILSELEAEIRNELNALGGSEIVDTLLKFRF